MNKSLLTFAVFAILAFASCSKTSPEANAEKFLNAYYTFDIDAALEVSSDETKDFMNMIKGMIAQNPIPDSIMETFKETKIEIHKKDISMTGDTMASIPYTLTMPEKSMVPPMEKTLKMVKRDGKWLAQYTMLDAMAENQQAQQELQGEQESIENTSETIKAADSAIQESAEKPETPEEATTEEAPATE